MPAHTEPAYIEAVYKQPANSGAHAQVTLSDDISLRSRFERDISDSTSQPLSKHSHAGIQVAEKQLPNAGGWLRTGNKTGSYSSMEAAYRAGAEDKAWDLYETLFGSEWKRVIDRVRHVFATFHSAERRRAVKGRQTSVPQLTPSSFRQFAINYQRRHSWDESDIWPPTRNIDGQTGKNARSEEDGEPPEHPQDTLQANLSIGKCKTSHTIDYHGVNSDLEMVKASKEDVSRDESRTSA